MKVLKSFVIVVAGIIDDDVQFYTNTISYTETSFQLVNLLIHAPSLSLSQGWHRLQVTSNQRLPAGNPNAGQLRRSTCLHLCMSDKACLHMCTMRYKALQQHAH